MRYGAALVTLALAGLFAGEVFVGPRDAQAEDDPVGRAVTDHINGFRKTAGLAPVVLDADLSRSCQAHADYLVRHDARMWGGRDRLDPHDERPEMEGYSDEGRKAARSSIIAWVEPKRAIDNHMEGHFHRVPLLNPDLKKVGVGVARGGKYGWACVIDVNRGTGSTPDRPECVPWPADGQLEVPTHYYLEMPDPIPMTKDKKAGNPVTVTFAPVCKVAGARATFLEGPKKKPVEFWMSTPEAPADPIYQRNTIALFPKQPLSLKTVYTVTVECTINGKPWSKTWSFTTSGKGPSPRPH